MVDEKGLAEDAADLIGQYAADLIGQYVRLAGNRRIYKLFCIAFSTLKN